MLSTYVRMLLEDSRIDPSVCDNYAMRRASMNGHFEIVQLLLQDKRVDPSHNADNNFAIRNVSANSHLEVVRLLLQDHRVDPSADDNYAIRYSRMNNHDQVIRLLQVRLHVLIQSPEAQNQDQNAALHATR